MENSSGNPLKIKVCGMRESGNIEAVAALNPDFLGFVFFPDSPRYAAHMLDTELLRALPATIGKIGVFVNADTAHILDTLARYGLDGAQLHGRETPAQCAALRANNILVIKAFPVGASIDWEVLRPYEGECDYFLFDTLGAAPGGNGTVFDWELLRSYPLATPYLLAGGVGTDNVPAISSLHLPGLAGVDLNSRFETAPGHKDPVKLALAISMLRHQPAPGLANRAA